MSFFRKLFFKDDPEDIPEDVLLAVQARVIEKLAFPDCGHPECYVQWYLLKNYPHGPFVMNN